MQKKVGQRGLPDGGMEGVFRYLFTWKRVVPSVK